MSSLSTMPALSPPRPFLGAHGDADMGVAPAGAIRASMRAVLAFVAAAAAVTTEATELCKRADVERYFAELESRAALSA